MNNIGPRIGFNWAPGSARTSIHGGYGIYYDRDDARDCSRSNAVSTAARCRSRSAPATHSSSIRRRVDSRRLRRRSRTRSPGSSFRAPARPESTSSTTALENPTVQQFNLGVAARAARDWCVRVDGVHNLGTHFIIGRAVGTVFNPVVGGPDRVVNLESSVNTLYDALLVSAEQRGARFGFRGRLHTRQGVQLRQRRSDSVRERADRSAGPAARVRADAERPAPPADVRGVGRRPRRDSRRAALDDGSAVPMDILMPDAQSRVPVFQRNAGGRLFHSAADLNRASVTSTRGEVSPATHCRWSATRRDSATAFNSFDFRVSRPFNVRPLAGSSRRSKCSTCST